MGIFYKLGMLDYLDKSALVATGHLGYVILSIALALCAGLLAGHTAATFKPVGKTFLGTLAGYFFGSFVYNLFFVFWNKALVTLVIS